VSHHGGVAGGLVHCSSAWPAEAAKQSEFDSVVCDVCRDPGGFDNMAICSGCDRCMHLRCVMPPQSPVPTSEWFCPGCDPLFGKLEELFDANPILQYSSCDPYCIGVLLAFVRSRYEDAFLEGLPSRTARVLRHRTASLRPQPPSLTGG
jgi:hypothetical protein